MIVYLVNSFYECTLNHTPAPNWSPRLPRSHWYTVGESEVSQGLTGQKRPGDPKDQLSEAF